MLNNQIIHPLTVYVYHTHTHTRLTALFPGLPGWAGTRKVKPIWILLKQETVSGSGISWAICKSAPRSRQITMPAPHHSKVFYRPDALPAAQPTASKHWRQRQKDTKAAEKCGRRHTHARLVTATVKLSPHATLPTQCRSSRATRQQQPRRQPASLPCGGEEPRPSWPNWLEPSV